MDMACTWNGALTHVCPTGAVHTLRAEGGDGHSSPADGTDRTLASEARLRGATSQRRDFAASYASRAFRTSPIRSAVHAASELTCSAASRPRSVRE